MMVAMLGNLTKGADIIDNMRGIFPELLRFARAGHILGSASVYLALSSGKATHSVVFSGDLGRYGRPVLPDPTPVAQADVLLLESTYGDRLHEPDDRGDRLAEIVTSVAARGGKLIMTYGWADPILQPMMGVKYYEQAVAKNGPATTDFFRLFMIPGMGHCAGGIGTDRFDSMTALISWVEKNKAPDSMLATRAVNGQVVRSRPLCPYPQEARYSGQGSVDDAANFSCRQ